MWNHRQSAELAWPDMGIVLESGEILGERKGVQGLPHFASDIRLLRAFVIGRMERLEEIIPPMSECLRAVCDLMSDVLTTDWNKKVLRAIGYSMRSVGKDELVLILSQAVEILTC